MEKSFCCLCPRGYGGSSFRYFEAMQLGVVPVHIGDNDIRPFKRSLEWDSVSFYFEKPEDAITELDTLSEDVLETMGKRAKEMWNTWFEGSSWCRLVLVELAQDIEKVGEN